VIDEAQSLLHTENLERWVGRDRERKGILLAVQSYLF
jgi:hypothetical protein